MVVCDQQNHVCKMLIEPSKYSFDKFFRQLAECSCFCSECLLTCYRGLIEQSAPGNKGCWFKIYNPLYFSLTPRLGHSGCEINR